MTELEIAQGTWSCIIYGKRSAYRKIMLDYWRDRFNKLTSGEKSMFTLTREEAEGVTHDTGEPVLPLLHVIHAPNGNRFFDTGVDSIPIEEVVTLLNLAWNQAQTETVTRIREALDLVPVCGTCHR